MFATDGWEPEFKEKYINKRGNCCFCNKELGYYESKFIHADGRIACWPKDWRREECGEERNKYGDLFKSKEFVYYTDG